MTVRFGILGSGFMAATYARCLAAHVPDGALTAVALGSRAMELATAHGAAREASAEALLARPDVDAVIIATPHSTHLPLTALAAAGTTVVVTTHFMEEAEYCDRIAIQDAGRLLALGTPNEVRAEAPGTADMNAAFMGIVEQARAHGLAAEESTA